jgi:SAM-dependent methyltransferase
VSISASDTARELDGLTTAADPAPRAGLSHRLYVSIAGKAPDLRPWHYQWLLGIPLYTELRPLLGSLRGSVLDVGCGYKPYRSWMPEVTRHYGIDVFAGPEVDAVITAGKKWPVRDGEFDAVLCTQVLEHVADLDVTLSELIRALRPGGEAVITMPFIASEHNSPHDYRRLSRHGLPMLLRDRLEIISVRPHGGVGSTVGALLLSWTYDALPKSAGGRLLVVPFLPIWMSLCLIVNLAGLALDRLDHTGLYYGNILVHARRPASAPVKTAESS